MTLVTRTVLAAALGLSSLTLGGCLIGASSSIDEQGTPVDGSVVARIEPGVTTEAWLISTLGAPTSATDVADGSGMRILRYDHVVRRKGGGYVFLVFAASSSSRRTSRTFFEITDGIVTDHWTDAGV
jgi:hypothetical protein